MTREDGNEMGNVISKTHMVYHVPLRYVILWVRTELFTSVWVRKKEDKIQGSISVVERPYRRHELKLIWHI